MIIPAIDAPDLFLPVISGEECLTGVNLAMPAISPEGCILPGVVAALPPPPPVTLLTDLLAYYKLDEHTGPAFGPGAAVDATGGEDLTLNGTGALANAGIINTCFHNSSSSNLSHVDDALFGIGAGVSRSFSLWAKGNGFGFSSAIAFSKWNASHKDYALYKFGDGVVNQLIFTAFDTNGVRQSVVFNGATSVSVWHFIACGYDAGLEVLWIQFDNSPRVTAPCVGVRRTVAPFVLADCTGAAVDLVPSVSPVGDIDELGVWARPLSLTDVNELFGGGTPPPYTGSAPF